MGITRAVHTKACWWRDAASVYADNTDCEPVLSQSKNETGEALEKERSSACDLSSDTGGRVMRLAKSTNEASSRPSLYSVHTEPSRVNISVGKPSTFIRSFNVVSEVASTLPAH